MSETKNCQNCKKDFTIEPDDFGFYEKIKVPPPTFCPECRYQRRLTNRNEWNFYKRDCSLCGKDMVSIYNKDYPGPVYCQPCYWSDNWDSLSYGRDFDFNRPFFEQFFEHRFRVPRIALANEGSVNSEYTNQSNRNKNCYMMVATQESEDCMYGNWNAHCKECMDCWVVHQCELLYESIDCHECYRSAFLQSCHSMVESYFSTHCRGSTNCFGCVGLRKKSYCWFNEQLTKEEYTKRFSAIVWDRKTISDFQAKFKKFKEQFPTKYYHGTSLVNCSGDYVGFSKNAHDCFNCFDCENFRFGQDAWQVKDSYDLTETADNQFCYELEGVGWGNDNVVSCKQWYGSGVSYSELSLHSDNLFGCVSMIKKKYCIFNKQYSKEDYLVLKEKIIEHMRKTGEYGEFFPTSISPFAYNESVAQEYFPLTKEEALTKGYKWYDRPERNYVVTKKFNELPKTIDLVPDSIVSEVISCSTQETKDASFKYLDCLTAFRVTPDELTLYRKMGIPLPEKCHACRRQDRLGLRNPRKLWHRGCMCDKTKHFHGAKQCDIEFETSYAPDRPELVYCEKCYQQEVY